MEGKMALIEKKTCVWPEKQPVFQERNLS